MNILNLILFIGVSALPSLLYILIIKLTSPYKSISLRVGFEYFGVGFGSILLLYFLMFFWKKGGLDPFYDHFFVIAPREELAKFISFFMIYKLTDKPKGSHPISTMFYFGMVGLGFAMFENAIYAYDYGGFVLIPRFLTATIAHMLFGMFFGYWIALGDIKYTKYMDRSVFGNLMYNSPRTKTIILTFIGYLSAVIYHGLWNYNLETSDRSAMSIMLLMVIFGLVGAKFAAKDLNDKYRRSLG